MIDLKNCRLEDIVKIIEKIEDVIILRVEDSIISIFNGMHLFVRQNKGKDVDTVEIFGVVDIPEETRPENIPSFISNMNDISTITKFRYSGINNVIYLQASILAYGMVDEVFFTSFITTSFKEALKANSYATIINEVVDISGA